MMDSIISANQSTFLGARQILDNVIMGYKCMHRLKRKSNSKEGYFCLKLDMVKAYAKVKWEYLRLMMVHLDFSAVWVHKIMSCVCLASFSILINGVKVVQLSAGKGLHQECLLLLFFIYHLCREFVYIN